MPIYLNHCDACGHEFKDLQTMSEPPYEECPVCKEKKLRRIIGSGITTVFKGSGFYNTDYKERREKIKEYK